MQLTSTIAETWELLDAARADGKSVGLVPTMGFLHAGHASLIRASAADNDVTLTTIFVNPLQFAADEDLSDYPRDLDRDLELCQEAGATMVLAPSVDEMYRQPIITTVSVADLSQGMEGAERPTHFDGVATVVSKLFNIGGRCRAYFGEKDFQQLLVVRQLAHDLSLPVEVVGCAIVREADGLAMSSRNAYLQGADRVAAPVLQRALRHGAEVMDGGETEVVVIRRAIETVVAAEPRAELDYVAVVDAATLLPPERDVTELRLLVAARVGPARLIDNIGATRAPRS